MKDFDNSPIRPGIDGRQVKTFEELLELQLQAETKTQPENVGTKPKKPFLRKGAGLERFKSKYDSIDLSTECLKYKADISTDEESFHELPKPIKFSPRKRLLVPRVTKKAVKFNSSLLRRNKKNPVQTSTPKDKPVRPVVRKAKAKAVTVMPRLVPLTQRRTLIQHTKNVTVQKKQPPKPSIQRNPANTEKADTLTNLEKLLQSVRHRKDELIRIQNAKEVSKPEVSRNVQPVVVKEVSYHPRKQVHWQEEDAAHEYDHSFEHDHPPVLSAPAVGAHSVHLLQNINLMENRLKELQVQCSSKLQPVPLPVKQDDSFLRNELLSEINNLKEQIGSLGNNLKALQLAAATNNSAKTALNRNSKISVERSSQRSKIITAKSKISVTKADSGSPVVYYYQDGTSQTTFPDGTTLIEFPNGQTERTEPSGVKQITYPDRLRRTILNDGSEEIELNDGTTVQVMLDGTEIILLPNGEREVRTKEYSRREYLNGTIKTVYSDGTQETRYSNGRLRIKDKYNNLLVDSQTRVS
ncbi:Centromere protein J [Halotydeus destructor]|nr:Centromere protein J [Halotydeus destructor]